MLGPDFAALQAVGHLLERPLPAAREEAVGFSALARNEQFAATLAQAGFDVKEFFPFRDHHVFRPDDLEKIRAAAGGRRVVTTEKDMARIGAPAPFDLAALRVGVEFLSGWEALSGMILEKTALAAGP